MSSAMEKMAAARLLLDLVQRKSAQNMYKEAGMRDSLVRMLGGTTKSPSVLPKVLGALGLGGLGYAGYKNRDAIKDMLTTSQLESILGGFRDTAQERKEEWGAQQGKIRQDALNMIYRLLGITGESPKTTSQDKIDMGPIGR